MEKITELSVFFPAYNEEGNIASTVEKALKVLGHTDLKQYEVIIVNDGSKDNTGKIADTLADKYKEVKVVHQPNGGYGCALRVGFDSAKFDWIVYTDADGQFDFSEVTKFLEKAKEADVIYGYKIKRNDNIFRVLAAKGWGLSLFLFFGLRVKDVDTGFKMVKREVLEKIPPLQSTRGGMINAELAIKAQRAGFKIARVAVHHYPRLVGSSTGVSLKVIFKSYIELFKLWWKIR